ncbi:lytic transglycosylase domain-containing protein [Caldimonas caldifontis]|uniref:Lytic transglycosylase n=1 Tax=Caldimonas caldifontis TaxID=1452508 RepID=A0A2S5SV98_9BURK|nr:lytic transglycosylase domain-containing protein [Caldimonas caldifontis]PPE66639.1 lytic transglycosylase [Caldimonas caldifontis]
MRFLPKSFDYRRALWAMAAVVLVGCAPLRVDAQGSGDLAQQAKEAHSRKDGARLQALLKTARSQRHPLTPWIDYWELNLRLPQASAQELAAFYARWPDSYVEDRLRNDWLLELGRRGDWAQMALELPRFRMRDDRELHCYEQLLRQQNGEAAESVREAARQAWFAQRDADVGCATMATQLYAAGVLRAEDVWRKARLATDQNRPRAVRQALELLGASAVINFNELYENPARYVARAGRTDRRDLAELTALALIRLGASDPALAATQMQDRWAAWLPDDLASWVWASIGRQAAIRLLPEAADHYQRAARKADERSWSDDTLVWKARAALRVGRWPQVLQAIEALSPSEQRDPTWMYWKARALRELAATSGESERLRGEAFALLDELSGQYHFYGKLAAEALDRPHALPPAAAPLTPEERERAAGNPGLQRALRLIELGLRSEGVREWNWTLNFTSAGRMGDRELLAAAQLACDRQVWDRCINTSERTQAEFNFEQRFPMPFRREVVLKARELGVDPAVVYGLIRQESRFIMDARSHVGASGLMQLMPATARWTARQIGLNYQPSMINDRDVNLTLGMSYLKLVVEDQGSLALGAAAYNAGPGRPRRWREGPVLEAPIWIENIPFNETRDYVKKVLSNATYYDALMNDRVPRLRDRLESTIGPRAPTAPAPRADLP